MSVSLIVLTLNELDGIKTMLPRIKKEWVDEIVIVDGGSTDGTIEYAKKENYKVVVQDRNGRGEGFRVGLNNSIGDTLIYFSPDGNEIPEDIPNLLKKQKEGYDQVIASRFSKDSVSHDATFIRRLGNNMFTWIINKIWNLGKYIDIYDNAGRQIRFYFHGGLGGATDNPPPTPAGGEVRAVYAATDKETIAENFRSMVSGTKEGGNDCDGCLDNSVLVFDTFISGNKTTVLNKKQGPMKDAVISSGLSDYITLARKVQGKIQSPRPLPIPQLDITLKTKVKVASVYEPPSGEELPTSFSYELPIYKDGTRLQFESEQLILDITENNAPFLRENMEVEVFKVEEDENGVEELMPLMFEKGVDFIVDNILLDGREIANKLEANRLGIEEGPHMVNYFLDLAVDKEIDIDVEQIRNYEINVNPYLRDRNEEEPCDDDAANNNNTGVY